MGITENVAKVVWGIAIASVTIWLSSELFFPLLVHLFSADLSFFAFILAFIVSSLFMIAVWGFFAYGASIVGAALGFVVGLIAEIMVWLYHKTRA